MVVFIMGDDENRMTLYHRAAGDTGYVPCLIELPSHIPSYPVSMAPAISRLQIFVIPDLIRDPLPQRRKNGSRIKSGMTRLETSCFAR